MKAGSALVAVALTLGAGVLAFVVLTAKPREPEIKHPRTQALQEMLNELKNNLEANDQASGQTQENEADDS